MAAHPAPTPPRPPRPPALPSKEHYAACYCEENAYILATHLADACARRNDAALASALEAAAAAVAAAEATAAQGVEGSSASTSQRISRQVWDVDVVIVSNANRTVALWQQRASADDSTLVIWDYHVFVLVSCSKVEQSLAQLSQAAQHQNGGKNGGSGGGGNRLLRRSSSSSMSLNKLQAKEEGSSFLSPPGKKSGLLRKLSSSSLRSVTQRSSSGGVGVTTTNGSSSPTRQQANGDSSSSITATGKNDLNDSSTVTHLQSWVYDVDSRLGPGPVPLPIYIQETFRIPEQTSPPYRARFRVVAVNDYLAYFCSDRRHMMLITPRPSLASTLSRPTSTSLSRKSSSGEQLASLDKEPTKMIQWAAPPPPWPPICGPLAKVGRTNLMSHYVDMRVRFKSRYGIVLTDKQFCQAAWKRVRPGATLEGVGELELSVRSLRDLEEMQSESGAGDGEDEDEEEEGEEEVIAEAAQGRGALAGSSLTETAFAGRLQHQPALSNTNVENDLQRSLQHGTEAMIATGPPPPPPPPFRAPPPPPPGSETVTGDSPRRGGRVKNQLFPAYLAASLQHRAARARGSYSSPLDLLDTSQSAA